MSRNLLSQIWVIFGRPINKSFALQRPPFTTSTASAYVPKIQISPLSHGRIQIQIQIQVKIQIQIQIQVQIQIQGICMFPKIQNLLTALPWKKTSFKLNQKDSFAVSVATITVIWSFGTISGWKSVNELNSREVTIAKRLPRQKNAVSAPVSSDNKHWQSDSLS